MRRQLNLLALVVTAVATATLFIVRAVTGQQTQEHTVFLPHISSPAQVRFDMVEYMVGDGRLYEVRHNSGSQARHQTQFEGIRFFHTKGSENLAEWEELWSTDEHIFRGTDTSPGNDLFYTLWEDGTVGSAWAPRFWQVGDLFERQPFVRFYRKSDCVIVAEGSQTSWLRFEAYYPTYTFPGPSQITLPSVIELAWLLEPGGQPEETYFYAKDFGLVGWSSVDRGFSAISEIHAPGARPDNTREVIACLKQTRLDSPPEPEEMLRPLPAGLRVK